MRSIFRANTALLNNFNCAGVFFFPLYRLITSLAYLDTDFPFLFAAAVNEPAVPRFLIDVDAFLIQSFIYIGDKLFLNIPSKRLLLQQILEYQVNDPSRGRRRAVHERSRRAQLIDNVERDFIQVVIGHVNCALQRAIAMVFHECIARWRGQRRLRARGQ